MQHAPSPEAVALPGFSFSVVEAPAAQTEAVLMLLPELLPAEVLPPTWWVAHLAGRPEALVGAAAFVPRLQDPQAPAFPCLVRVLPPYRRRGVGRALMACMTAEARRWDVDALAAWQACGGGEAAFLQAAGFAPYLAVYYFLGTLSQALPLCVQREDALRAHGRIPPGMRLAPLSDVPIEAVAALYRQQDGGAAVAVRRHIEAALSDVACRQLSVAASDDAGLAGFLLATVQDGVPTADLWLSDPSRRQGAVAAITLHASLQRSAAMGALHFRFHCNERALATLNFARRCGAVLQGTRHGFRLALGPEGA